MWEEFKLFPERASSLAAEVDLLYGYLVAISVFFTGLIGFLVVFFAVRYRHGRRGRMPRSRPLTENIGLEVTWAAIPLALCLVMFFWGSKLYLASAQPPANALDVYIVGKQWMWKVRHREGRREINELHVPVGEPARLTMISEDVIHSFYVPAFRVKADVLPGRFRTLWFEPTRTGVYHLFCAEYCGTNHSRMIGRVIVMERSDYARWLGGGVEGEPLAVAGRRVFERLGCRSCHAPGAGTRGPLLDGVFGSQVRIKGGATVTADESYVRESILDPRAKIVEGYEPIMPAYEGQIGEERLIEIIEYIKSLSHQ